MVAVGDLLLSPDKEIIVLPGLASSGKPGEDVPPGVGHRRAERVETFYVNSMNGRTHLDFI